MLIDVWSIIQEFKERRTMQYTELGENPVDVALAWLLAQPAVTASVIGRAPRSS
jgi:aryl-alcohol dehydrogenase-like predicted oxidoreductase